jgi:hypothetical protein
MALARILAVWLSLTAVGAAYAAAEAVGEVSLAIGVGRLIGSGGNANPVVRGMPVHVGDRIETEQSGHVHVRFVDGAFVSVRPGSRLFIETYRYDSARPQDSVIRFNLERGVVRAISGKGAQAAPERFRLNTPIAALGVRGTDFVVLTEPERVRVAIYSGAIVLTPLGEGCRADALGPCATASTRSLSPDMGKVMLEFQPQQGAPRLVPINGMLSPDRLNPPAPEESRGGAHNSQAAREAPTEVLAAQAVAQKQPTLPPLLPPPPPATMIWGHWMGQPWPGDTISQSYDVAHVGRQVTVGNEYFALFREEPPLPVLVSNLGKVDFTLRDAQVFLLRGNAASLGSVNSAWLSVDFAARQFATGIAMSHPDVGAASLQAAGSVRDDGIFVARTADGRVAGGLTVDGKEAGYFFERLVPGGSFVGITRWFH